MQKVFTFNDTEGQLKAGILETTDDLYKRIISYKESLQLLIVKGKNYHYATPYSGPLELVCDTWQNIIPLTENPMKVLVLGDSSGIQTLGLLLTYAYPEGSMLEYCNPFSENKSDLEKLTVDTLSKINMAKKLHVYPEHSFALVPLLESGKTDIVYLDLHTDPKFLLEDLILVWRKLKKEGHLVVNNVAQSQKALTAFLTCYEGVFTIVGEQNNKLFIKKTLD
jgi:hypothetical protein